MDPWRSHLSLWSHCRWFQKYFLLNNIQFNLFCPCFSFFTTQRGQCPLCGWSYFELIVTVLNLASTYKYYEIGFVLEKTKLNKKKKKEKKIKTNKMIHIFITAQPGLWHNALQFCKQSIQIIGYKITFWWPLWKYKLFKSFLTLLLILLYFFYCIFKVLGVNF